MFVGHHTISINMNTENSEQKNIHTIVRHHFSIQRNALNVRFCNRLKHKKAKQNQIYVVEI